MLRQLKRKPLRTWLVILQTTVGAFTLILALSAYLGTPRLASASDTFDLVSGSPDEQGGGTLNPIFQERDLQAIQKLAPDIESLGIYGRVFDANPLYVFAEDKAYLFRDQIVASAGYFDILGVSPVRGSFFAESDRDQNVVVISEQSAKIIFGEVDPIGQEISVAFDSTLASSREFFSIVGTFDGAKQIKTGWGHKMFEIPPLIFASWSGEPVGSFLEFIVARAKRGQGLAARTQLLSAVRQYYKDSVDAELLYSGKDFYLTETKRTSLNTSKFVDPITILFSFFGIVSLIISSIGGASFSLVNSLERAHEFGIRRAIGASRSTLIANFVRDTAFLTLLGGLLGMLLSIIVIPIINNTIGDVLFVQSNLQWQPLAASIALATAVCVNMLFGFLAVRRYIHLTPVEALREK